MKRLFLLISFACALCTSRAQHINTDSLLQVVISRESSVKTSSSLNRDSLLRLFPSTKSVSARINIIYDIIYNYGYLGPKQAFYFHNKILELTRKENDPVGEAIILSELGDIYFHNGDVTKGLNMIFGALDKAEKTGNKQALGIVYNNLGLCYPDDVHLSKFYYQKALKFSQAADDNLFICFELAQLSVKYQQLNKPDSSRYYLLKSFDLSVRKDVEQAIQYNLLTLGDQEKDQKLRLKYYHAALNVPFTRRDSISLWSTLQSIAYYYREHGVTDSALFYAKKAYYAASNLFLEKKILPAQFLAQLYTGRNADSALKYTNIYYISRDSMYNMTKMRASLNLAYSDQQRRRELEAQKTAYQTRLQFYILLLFITFFNTDSFYVLAQ